MTPADQITASDAAHASFKHLLDLLALWEAVDEATLLLSPNHNSALDQLREDVGTAEMRDLCVTLHPYLQQTYDAYADEFGSFDDAFDWEFIPLFLGLIDWAAVSYTNVYGHYQMTFTDLPPAAETARKIHERYSR
jgi:hypothetical protein